MMRAGFLRSVKNGDIAIVIVVLAGYGMYYASEMYDHSSTPIAITILLGLFYLATCFWGSHRLTTASVVHKAIFFTVAISLGGLISYLTNGGTWLMLLPLVSEAIQHLPGIYSTISIGLIWLASIFPLLLIASLTSALSTGMAYLSAIVFVAVFTNSTMREQSMRIALSDANKRLREYANRIEQNAILEERNRLAREIHDGLGHYLTAVNIQLKAAQAILTQDPEEAARAVNKAQVLTEEALADVRRSVSALRTDQPVSQKASQVVRILADSTSSDQLAVTCTQSGEEPDLPPHLVFTLYRIAQEALTNVQKHSGATQASIGLDYQTDRLILTIADNGSGMDPSDQPAGEHFGLVGLRERVRLMGGETSILTSPGRGVTLRVDIPILQPRDES
jgi:signal transduction histidine kinase